MSGNPFRKAGDSNARQPFRNPAATPREEPIRKVVKKVQFVSPLTSPEIVPRQPWPDPAPYAPEIPDLPIDPNSTQPIPSNGLASDETGVDTRALLRGDPTGGGTVDLGGPTPTINPSTDVLSKPSGNGAPINPFAKTLATMEPEQRAAAVLGAASKGRPEIAQPTPARSTMDVDAFKRLLMTGTSGVSMAPAVSPRQEKVNPAVVPSPPAQSPYETVHEPQPKSPRSSSDSASSTQAEETVAEDPVIKSNRDNSNATASQPPPLPVHRHGKSVEPKAPQTVSFDDFDSEFADFDKDQVASKATDGGRPTLSRSMSDLNKPLPNPPTSSMSGLQIGSSSVEPTPAIENSTYNNTFEETQKKIAPPPPPTARRQAQTKTRSPNPLNLEQPPSGRGRSGSNLSQASARSEESTASKASNRPAPPPPRQAAASSGDATFDIVRDTSTAPSAESASISNPKMRPPPPPSRQSARPAGQITRTPSSQSSSSLQNRRASTHGGLAPPPPPPPRRGAPRGGTGDDSGIHSRRSSGQSMTSSERKDSVSSLQRSIEERADEIVKHAVDAQLPPSDLLADLDAFQREVDALRAKALRGT
ncbi:hypothetical protein MBLNU457_g2756t1 [Dothideomycetes sp. NU457]